MNTGPLPYTSPAVVVPRNRPLRVWAVYGPVKMNPVELGAWPGRKQTAGRRTARLSQLPDVHLCCSSSPETLCNAPQTAGPAL